MTTPDVITHYLRAADAQDPRGCAQCFAEDGTVVDEDVTYRGRDEIRTWREQTLARWTWTSTVTGLEPMEDDRFVVRTHLVGNFPGGEVDLAHLFTLRDGRIAALVIAP